MICPFFPMSEIDIKCPKASKKYPKSLIQQSFSFSLDICLHYDGWCVLM